MNVLANAGNLVGSLTPLPSFIQPAKMSSQIAYAFGVAFVLTGIAATGFMIKAGLDYATSNGDPSKIKSAQATMTNAVLGFVVSLAAYAILQVIKGALGIGALTLDLK